ncbi:hypothetical protein AK830_g8001 [Neonectria ditissima]|uniref:Transcription factor domain-containing protein n=1 Tax=Neonectria ditissima TaxID=78410 RepID=A0A0P7BF49_9HYPO|nr:hypothetical protein AK830_g8001 [Neonectria ditissima]
MISPSDLQSLLPWNPHLAISHLHVLAANMEQTSNWNRRPGVTRRRRIPGTRTHHACINCREKKLKVSLAVAHWQDFLTNALLQCDDQAPGCQNCVRLGISCRFQDPQTKEPRLRNHIEVLEERVAFLEGRGQRTSSQSTSSPFAATANSNNTSIANTNSQPNPYTPDQGDTTSELSSRVGILDFQATQMEPQYLGSSSTFAFSRIINFSLSRDLPMGPTLGTLGDRHTSPSPCLLPDHDVALKLSNAYFKYIHPQYPFLHEPTFRAWEAMLYESPPDVTEIGFPSGPLFFLNMIYAVAALLLPNSQTLAEQLYMSAQVYTDVISRDNLESIQAILKLSGLALRQCIELGYHRGIKRLRPTASPLQLEMRKRVFWVVQGIDCTVALRLGRPLGIRLQDIDAEFPLDIDDASITDTGMSSLRSSSKEPLTTMSTAIHVFKLRCIWARIHTSLFSDVSRLDGENATHDACVRQLREDLDVWLATAPPARPRASDDLSIFTIKDWYGLNYSYTLLLLYRGQMAEYKETSDQIFQECIDAARKICQGYRQLYIGTTIKHTWSTLHCLFVAGLTYLHCLWTLPTTNESVSLGDVTKTCTDCTMVLVAIAEGWQGAAPYRDTFEALAARTLTMLISRRSTVSPPLISTTLSEPPIQESWAQLMSDVAETSELNGDDGLLARFFDDFVAEINF